MVAPIVKKKAAGPEAGRRRPADSVERAYTAIRRMVVDFALKPDERINEFQLAREFALSRTPIREALNRLASEGFLVLSPNRGFFFRSLDIDDLVGFYELRGILEKGAFALSCQRATDAEMRRLAAFWERARRLYRKRDPDQILELDEGFHLTMAGLSGNPEIVRQLTAVNARIRFARRVEIERGPRHDLMIDEHAQLVAALAQRDAGRGMALLDAHISLSVEDARAALKEVLLRQYETTPPARRTALEPAG